MKAGDPMNRRTFLKTGGAAALLAGLGTRSIPTAP
ncbi:MAG: twin-arginine translocation signal domain-containing protein [Calditrichaeota bacterium]|nr:twin-arginine translocation signal domain-containing protein [Calditrichota bacterium]